MLAWRGCWRTALPCSTSLEASSSHEFARPEEVDWLEMYIDSSLKDVVAGACNLKALSSSFLKSLIFGDGILVCGAGHKVDF